MRPSHSLIRPTATGTGTSGAINNSGLVAPKPVSHPPAAAAVISQHQMSLPPLPVPSPGLIPNPVAPARHSSFDDDFGDGSDLMDVEDILLTGAKIVTPTVAVKKEPDGNMQTASGAPATTESMPTYLLPPLPPLPPSEADAAKPNTATPNVLNLASPLVRNGPMTSPTITAATTSFPTSDPIAARRIAELEVALKAKTEAEQQAKGEAKTLRNRMDAMEKKKWNETIAAATARQQASPSMGTAASTSAYQSQSARGATSNIPWSNSQIPTSQHQQKKQENEAMARFQSQLEAIKAQKESAELQTQEYVKENNQMRRKMAEMQQQLQQKANLNASTSSPTITIPANNQQRAVMSIPASATMAASSSSMTSLPTPPPAVAPLVNTSLAPVAAVPPLASGAQTSDPMTWSARPTIARVTSLDSANRWQIPSFIHDLEIECKENPLANHRVYRIQAMDIPIYSQLLIELQSYTGPLSPTPPATSSQQRSSVLEEVGPRSAPILDRLSHHLISSMQAVLTHTASLSSTLIPLRQLLLTCILMINLNSSSSKATIPIPSSTSSLVPQSSLSKSVSNEASGGSGTGWDRSVRVKLEHQSSTATAVVATSSSSAAAPKSVSFANNTNSSPTNMDTKRTTSSTNGTNSNRDSKQIRSLITTLLQILQFSVSRDSTSAQLIYQKLFDSNPFLPSKQAPKHVDHLVESMNWSNVLIRLFDDTFNKLYLERSSNSNNPSAVSGSSSSALSLLELITSTFCTICTLGMTTRDKIKSLLVVWLPRLTQLIARLHANYSLKHPIVATNANTLEDKIHISVTQLVYCWCAASTSSTILSVIQPASQVAVSGQVKSSSIESASPCNCNLLQLLLVHAMKQSISTSISLLSTSALSGPTIPSVTNVMNLEWMDLLLQLITTAQRCYLQQMQQPDGIPITTCTIHARDWGEREIDLSLLESTCTLFGLPFAIFRLLLASFQDLLTEFQSCIQAQVQGLVEGTTDMDDIYNDGTPAASTLTHDLDCIHQLSIALKILIHTLRIHHRRWKELQSESAWSQALYICRLPIYVDFRIDFMLQNLHEGCLMIQQCQQQLKAATNKPQQIGNEQSWSEMMRSSAELIAWFSA